MSDPMDAIRQSFFEECTELLEELELGLLAMQDGTADEETIGAVFRAVHSIKGGAGAFALDPLTHFAHDFETVLDLIRDRVLTVDPDLALLLLRSADVLADIANACAENAPIDEETAATVRAELSQRAASVEGASAAAPDLDFPDLTLDGQGATGFAPLTLDLDDLGGDEPGPPSDTEDAIAPDGAWLIKFTALPGLLASGNEPLFFFKALKALGDIEVTCLKERVPPLDEIIIDEVTLAWDITLRPSETSLTQQEISDVFDFGEGLCTLDISKPKAAVADVAAEPMAPAAAAPNPPSPAEPVAAPPKPTEPVAAPPKPAPVKATRKEPSGGGDPADKGARSQSSSVRVDLQRIDDLVNLVGEIVIAQAMLSQIAVEPGREQEVLSCLDNLTQLTLEVQDSVMAIRALPVRPLFQRMSRIVREAAQMTGKDVRLVTEGEDTQIDKTVIELLADPLTHMVRNAVDHGLEDIEDRLAAGKSRQGTVTLSAAQRSDRVFVEISDDGAGINRTKVLEKAKKQGLVEPDAVLDPSEIDRLLFLPGFSTSDQISELSGRGVGMDVVNRAIQNLSGSISIRSEPGEGTSLTVSLPLTLAILDGMVLVNGPDRYVMPLAAIVETLTLAGADTQSLASGGRVVRVHGSYLPLFELSVLLGQSGSTLPEEDRTILVVDPGDDGPYGLLIDDIEAQRQVVVKGLAKATGHISGISAATILGNGQIALILDAAGLRQLAQNVAGTTTERLAS